MWHKSCKIEICGERTLQQALNWKRNNDANTVKQVVQIERPSAPPKSWNCSSEKSLHIVYERR